MKSQNACLLAIADAYAELVGGRAITMEEVSEWALARGLVPTPKRGGQPIEFEFFEARLSIAKSRGLLADEESPERKRGEAAEALLNAL